MKLYIQTDNIYGYIPLVTKPVSEQTISALSNYTDGLANAVVDPVTQKPGKFTITNIEYHVFEPTALKSDITSRVWYGTHQDIAAANTVKLLKWDVSASTDPLKFKEEDRLNLIESLKLLASVSHTHEIATVPNASKKTVYGKLSPTAFDYCGNQNNGSGGGNSDAGWWW
jgi:hypothetical protein